ncbi:MAG: adenylosuccinate synthetase [Deltaproteobacteria bacterium]|nr:adenylosuccinate synthetase [Deltaproteobacteria bacterium]
MGITVVIGGQFGSEGKGKTTSLLSRDFGDKCAVVRCGGPNSGHITYEHGREYCLRLLPSGVVYGRRLFLAPAAIVDLEVLRFEIEEYDVSPNQLSIDPFSVVITPEMKKAEKELIQSISSTGSGAGAAGAFKTMRHPETVLVKDILVHNSWLRPYVRDVRSELHGLLEQGYRIILEGTQGFGLSLHHSRMFPKTTSKDTTAAQFVMESGLSPLLVDQIVMVIRTFPIRVAGKQSGPMKNEITWDLLRQESGYPYDITELTTVTKKVRRVARFDMELVLDSCRVNRPTDLVIHGLDYIDYRNLGVDRYSELTTNAKEFLAMVQNATGVPIRYAFTGKDNSAVIDFTFHLHSSKLHKKGSQLMASSSAILNS